MIEKKDNVEGEFDRRTALFTRLGLCPRFEPKRLQISKFCEVSYN